MALRRTMGAARRVLQRFGKHVRMARRELEEETDVKDVHIEYFKVYSMRADESTIRHSGPLRLACTRYRSRFGGNNRIFREIRGWSLRCDADLRLK